MLIAHWLLFVYNTEQRIVEKKLPKLFDYQRFEQNEKLGRLIQETEGRYARELSDESLELVNAAGEAKNSSAPCGCASCNYDSKEKRMKRKARIQGIICITKLFCKKYPPKEALQLFRRIYFYHDRLEALTSRKSGRWNRSEYSGYFFRSS